MPRSLFAAAAAALFLATAPAKAVLYDDLGGEAGIDRIVTVAIRHFLADPVIAQTFDNANMDRLARLLKQQFCHLADGPCPYRGQSMAAVHHDLNLSRLHFNRLAEDLQDAMEEVGVGYHTQNRLMALLAPMQRDVVTQ